MLKEDLDILQEKRNVPESAFAKHFPDIHDRVVEYAKTFHREAWNEAKYIYANQLKTLPTCKICGKPVLFKSVSRGYNDTCCHDCDKKMKAQIHKQRWNNYTKEEREARIQKMEDTREAKTGYRTPFANPVVRQKIGEHHATKTSKRSTIK